VRRFNSVNGKTSLKWITALYQVPSSNAVLWLFYHPVWQLLNVLAMQTDNRDCLVPGQQNPAKILTGVFFFGWLVVLLSIYDQSF
jgi:hypothetical protein